MDGVDDICEWREAQRLREVEGDPSSLESLIVASAPDSFKEYVRDAIRQGLKSVTDRDRNLAEAVIWYVDHGGEIGRGARPNVGLLLEASRRYGLKTANGCSVLWNVVKAKDTAVNAELRRRGRKAI